MARSGVVPGTLVVVVATLLASPASALLARIPSGRRRCQLRQLRHRRPGTTTMDLRRLLGQGSGVDKGFNLLESAGGVLGGQGALVSGVKTSWRFAWERMMAELAPQSKDGAYKRPKYAFGGSIGSSNFPVESQRYHLYLGNPCPWCHRVSLVLALRGLEEHISTTRLLDDPTVARRGGWCFAPGRPDPLFGAQDLYEVYEKCQPGFQGRCTAPLLVDLKTKKIVSNESGDLIKMLNAIDFGPSAGGETDAGCVDLRPSALEKDIDATSDWIFHLVNNGVYRCGFSTSQGAYDQAAADVDAGLKRLDGMLAESPFLLGDKFTEADLRLLPTVLRFDASYAPLFRAAGGHVRIRDFPHLDAWLQRCWQLPGVPSTIDLEDAWSSYYRQLFPLNPGGLVPRLPSPESLGLTAASPATADTDTEPAAGPFYLK